jgi:heterodisulfide reductase subunit B
MKYLYFPGCSLETTSKQYDESLRSLFATLEVELIEIPDWNCCGATAYMSVDETISLSISARNLAIAEKFHCDVIAPCSACYTVLLKTHRFLREKPELKAKVNKILEKIGLSYNLSVRIRHPLDVIVNDIGIDLIKRKMKKNISDFSIAPYYGCQIVRPERIFDDKEFPESMDNLFKELGANISYFPLKTKCCGGMLVTTFNEIAEQLIFDILESAMISGANCIATTCPLCQVNLELYQNRISKKFNKDLHIPILFFTQLLGIALGIHSKKIGLQRNFRSLSSKLLEAVVS